MPILVPLKITLVTYLTLNVPPNNKFLTSPMKNSPKPKLSEILHLVRKLLKYFLEWSI